MRTPFILNAFIHVRRVFRSLIPGRAPGCAAGLLLGLTVAGIPGTARGVTFETVFSDNQGRRPSSALTQGKDGNFYGTTSEGGTTNDGTLFRMTPSGEVTTLLSFSGVRGRTPSAPLVKDEEGNFYGTTLRGGVNDNGTVFKVTPAGVLTTLLAFNGVNGAGPAGGLLVAGDGKLYGTTGGGGANNYGTIFKMTPAGALTTMVSFKAGEGNLTGSGLTQGKGGNFYGVSYGGGPQGHGTIYRVTPGGVLTILTSFNGLNGSHSYSRLAEGSDGHFYGTTREGGAQGFGTVFKVTATGGLTSLFSFSQSDGAGPNDDLVPGPDGNFYGTTVSGGPENAGSIFKVTPAGAVTMVASFRSTGPEGSSPVAGLTAGSDGLLYGTAVTGGTGGNGTVFRMNPADAALTTLYAFNGLNGFFPRGGVTEGRDGNFYGTASFGGANNQGTVFQVTPAGKLTTLHDFGHTPDGANPLSDLLEGGDGAFYGTTSQGGQGSGTVFKVTPAGVLSTLAAFTTATGSSATTGLTAGSDGNFYGVTGYTVFRVTPSTGAFDPVASFEGGNGGLPGVKKLAEGPDGNFYGTTQAGGTGNFGTVFRVTPAGMLTTLASFDGVTMKYPRAGLTAGSDGNFYGTVYDGGPVGSDGVSGNGAVFKVTSAGVLTRLFAFTGSTGSKPEAGLVQGSDGHFYGTTREGGSRGLGAIFKITPAGALTVLHSFDGALAAHPVGTPVFGKDGHLYGTADQLVVWRLRLDNLTPLQAWRQLYFGSSANTGSAADNADPDRDGLPNVIEWGCGLNPVTPGTLPVSLTQSGAGLEYTYSRNVTAVNAGTAFSVEWSADLSGGWSTAGTAAPVILSDNGVTQRVKVTVPAAPAPGERRFVRLRVTAPAL